LNFLDKIFNRFIKIGAVFGGACLIALTLLITVGIIVRYFGRAIPGIYELTEVIIIGGVGFALAYTTYMKGHVVVELLTERLPQRIRLAFETVTYFLSAVIWGAIVWASYNFMMDRWLGEKTDLIQIPLFPFRLIWEIGLILTTLAFLLNSIKAFMKMKDW